VDCDVLTDGDSDLKIVILTASPGSPDEAKTHRAMAADSAPAPSSGFLDIRDDVRGP
jgi:hypothetical protein